MNSHFPDPPPAPPPYLLLSPAFPKTRPNYRQTINTHPLSVTAMQHMLTPLKTHLWTQHTAPLPHLSVFCGRLKSTVLPSHVLTFNPAAVASYHGFIFILWMPNLHISVRKLHTKTATLGLKLMWHDNVVFHVTSHSHAPALTSHLGQDDRRVNVTCITLEGRLRGVQKSD